MLLLEGELGVGKTALWREAVARSPYRVLACRPVEGETQMPYAALGDLLAAVSLDGLPGPQRHALEVALLRAEPREPLHQRAVALGMLEVLRAEPTVLAIDDVQWLDHPSEVVLAFVARRLPVQVGLLASRRGGGALPLHMEEAARLTVGPLGPDALAELLGSLPRAELARVHRISGGNPFYALELAGCDEVPSSLRALAGGRITGLSDAGRSAVELASVLSRPTGSLVDASAAPGVLETDGVRVRFVHPLLRELAYESVADKRGLHARAAALVEEPEERARQLALAAEGPSEDIALALQDAAGRARARGAPDAAAELLEQARRLTPGSSWRRGVAAAERWLEAGDAERARALLEELLEEIPPGRDRAYALTRLSWVRAHADGFRAAIQSFRAALAEDAEPALRIEIEQGLSWCTHSVESVAAAQAHARRALALAEELGDVTLLAHALSHVAFLDSLGGSGMAMGTIERALALDSKPGWTQILGRPDWIHALLLLWDGRLIEARDRLAALHAEALERGDAHSLPFVLFQLARVHLLLGDWEAAERLAGECADTADSSGQAGERPYATAIVALVAAHRGSDAGFVAGLELAERLGVGPAALELLAARGFLELSRGEPADATFDELRARVEESGLREPALFRWHADAVEAYVAAGRREDAAALVAALDRSRPWVREVAARCDALVGAPVAAARVDATQPFERARTALVLGTSHRRARKWGAARSALNEALAAFESLGAPLWAEKARAELSRVGGRAPADGALTPTERQVAELIAAGRTYRETADALFISPKTVQWNLSKIYRKLGIRSRAELPAALTSDPPIPSGGYGLNPAIPPVSRASRRP